MELEEGNYQKDLKHLMISVYESFVCLFDGV